MIRYPTVIAELHFSGGEGGYVIRHQAIKVTVEVYVNDRPVKVIDDPPHVIFRDDMWDYVVLRSKAPAEILALSQSQATAEGC